MDGVTIHKLIKKEDERGWLLKVLMRQNIPKDKTFGEIYVTVAHPGAVKGKHYHKNSTEWFCVIKGSGKLILLDLESNQTNTIIMGDDNMVTVRVPPKMVHVIKNTGNDMMYLLAYADKPYDYNHPDTVAYNLDF